MRFRLQNTDDGSLTVFDEQSGESYKSRHAARLEAEHVFFLPGIRENPWLGRAQPLRILELGFGLGTNCSFLSGQGLELEFTSIDRDLAGLRFFLAQEKNLFLEELLEKREAASGLFKAKLVEADFLEAMRGMEQEKFHCIYFDPFSPKANPESWSEEIFRQAYELLAPEGRLVTYSVSRVAKDAAAKAGFLVEKREPPPELKKRHALLARKPAKI
jgi:tRNA U34 5-methylaminomethyl-2-thiouridine-forming methyltransferase MnmC